MNEIELKVRGGNQNPGRRPGKERGIRWEGCLNGSGWATRNFSVCVWCVWPLGVRGWEQRSKFSVRICGAEKIVEVRPK